jgi:polysaccharide export outer membrane protein
MGVVLLAIGGQAPLAAAQQTVAAAQPAIKIGISDAVHVQVFGRPELETTTYVSDDGTVSLPLVGAVRISGSSPAQASALIERAYRAGQYLVDPQVTVTLETFRSQQISVLGEVKTPGRYPIQSRTSILDLLAEAGGVTELGADVIYLLRPDADGQVKRLPIDLKGLASGQGEMPNVLMQTGDSIFVPKADQFYVYGEVANPNMYRLEAGMTVVQAISRSGGITPRGSESRIEIKRRMPDGNYKTLDASLADVVEANDVIRVKERIF